jgi:hypothetical protein
MEEHKFRAFENGAEWNIVHERKEVTEGYRKSHKRK